MGDVTVSEIWRYPVKSMQGETVPVADVDARGVPGDRQWGVVDLDTGLTLTARRAPDLLFSSSRLVAPDRVEVTLPDGTVTDDGAVLSDWLGRRVELRRARPDTAGTYEIARSIDVDDPPEGWAQWQGPEGTFHDSPRVQLSLASHASMAGWDRRRFRSNLVLDTSGPFEEDGLAGRRVAVGGAVLDMTEKIIRCVIVNRAQPDGIERDRSILRGLLADRRGCLGVGALVARGGRIAPGDVLTPI